MGRKRLCTNFTWRDNDPEYQANRDNDRLVFKKIKAMICDGRSADMAIDILFKSDFWHERMCSGTRRHPSGKSPASWKRCYYRWRAKITALPSSTLHFGDTVQAENSVPDPCIHCSKRTPEKFYQETGVKYPPPRG